MNEKKQVSGKRAVKNKHPENKDDTAKYRVPFLTSKNLIIKQNFGYPISLLYNKEDREKFAQEIGVDKKTILEFQALDRNVMPTDNIITFTERYFEDKFGVPTGSWRLDDKNLFEKLEQCGLDVVSTIRNVERIKKNIRTLREYYHDSPSDLARAIGVGTSSITNYEKLANGRLPDQEKLIAIAQHYRITVDEILNQEIKLNPMGNLSVISEATKDIIGKYLSDLIPFVIYPDSMSEEEKNAMVIQALDMQDSMLEVIILNTIEEHLEEFTKLMDLYENSAQEGDPVAIANHLGWIILFGIGIMGITDPMLQNGDKILQKETSVFKMLKFGLLPQPSKVRKSMTSQTDQLKREYIDKHEKLILQYIYELKHTGNFEIADYYNAIRYVFGVVRNKLSLELNSAIGHEMLRSLVLMRNPYAEDYYKACDEFRDSISQD